MLLLSLLLAATFDFPVSPPSYIPAAGAQLQPSVASNGESSFAVWSDTRTVSGVYGTRLTSDGHPLDPTGIYLGSGGAPRVVSCGRHWVVVMARPPELFAMALDRDGQIVTPLHIISNKLAISESQYLASNGATAVVTYARDTLDVATLDENANLVSFDVPLPESGPHLQPVIASNGRGFFVAWLTTTGADGVHLDANGKPIEPQPIHITSHPLATEPTFIASDGRDVLFAAQTTDGNTLLRRIAADGTLGDEVVQPRSALLAWTGDHYALLFRNGEGFALRTLERDGSSHDPGTMIDPNADASAQFSGATTGTNLLLVWSDTRDVLAMNVDTRINTPWPQFVIAFTATPQEPSSIAAGDNGYAITWQETTDSYLARLDVAGNPISYTRLNGKQPRVAWNGRDYDVAYITDQGVAVGVDALPVGSGCASELALASNGDVTLLVWSDCGSRLIYGIRIRHGIPIDTMPALISHRINNSSEQIDPHVVWNGSTFLVLWRNRIILPARGNPIPSVDKGVDAVRVTPELTPLDFYPIEIADLNTDAYAVRSASSGHETLVAYSRGQSIEATFVANDGSVSAPITIAESRYGELLASVTWTSNGDYLIAWREPFSGLTAVRITQSGDLSPRIPLAPNDALNPLIAAGSDHILMLYGRVSPEPLYGGVTRAFLHLLDAPRVRASGR